MEKCNFINAKESRGTLKCNINESATSVQTLGLTDDVFGGKLALWLLIAATSASSSKVMNDVLAEAEEHCGHVSSPTISAADETRVAISIGSGSFALVNASGSPVNRTWRAIIRRKHGEVTKEARH